MIALAWTYFPPIWLITFAYSFSAPTATITPAGAWVAPDAEEQALARAARPRANAAIRMRRMTVTPLPRGILLSDNDNDSQFHLQRAGEPG